MTTKYSGYTVVSMQEHCSINLYTQAKTHVKTAMQHHGWQHYHYIIMQVINILKSTGLYIQANVIRNEMTLAQWSIQ